MFLTVAIGVVGFLVVILAIYVGGNWFLWHLKKPKAPSDESVRQIHRTATQPRWEELEDCFGQPIPNAIKNLYARTELIKRRNFQITNESGKSYEIAEFLPADLETLNRVWSLCRPLIHGGWQTDMSLPSLLFEGTPSACVNRHSSSGSSF
jgi:hypothetical protein